MTTPDQSMEGNPLQQQQTSLEYGTEESPEPAGGCGNSGDKQFESAKTPPQIHRIIEALLFAGGTAISFANTRPIIRGLTEAQFTVAIDQLNRDYRRQGRPYAIQAQEGGYVLALRRQCRDVIERLHGQTKEARLSSWAVDVLALVAYKQPIAKSEIDAIRGADSSALVRQLAHRGLIAGSPREGSGSRELVYVTTTRFLDMFKLRSLEDLPQMQDLQQL